MQILLTMHRKPHHQLGVYRRNQQYIQTHLGKPRIFQSKQSGNKTGFAGFARNMVILHQAAQIQ